MAPSSNRPYDPELFAVAQQAHAEGILEEPPTPAMVDGVSAARIEGDALVLTFPGSIPLIPVRDRNRDESVRRVLNGAGKGSCRQGGAELEWVTLPKVKDGTDLRQWEVLSSNYAVELLDEVTQLPSGLLLPQGTLANNTDAVVLGVGPGRIFNTGIEQTLFAEEGDRVVFIASDFTPVDGPAGRQGFVRDENLVAILRAPDHLDVEPANEYLLVKPMERPTHEGSLALAEEYVRRPLAGVVQDMGPGKLKTAGPRAGTRVSVPEILGESREEILGSTIHWTAEAEVIELTDDSDTVAWLLVKASDVLFREA